MVEKSVIMNWENWCVEEEDRKISENKSFCPKKDTPIESSETREKQTDETKTETSSPETNITFIVSEPDYEEIGQLINLLSRDEVNSDPAMKEKYLSDYKDESEEKDKTVGLRLPVGKQCMKFEKYVKSKIEEPSSLF